VFKRNGTLTSEFVCPHVKVSQARGLQISSEGFIVTLTRNNLAVHVLVLETLYVKCEI
jgi:hypothetical protein